MNFIANMMRSGNDPRIKRSGTSSLSASDQLVRGIGWFSIALGLTEIFAARRIARGLGMHGKEGLIRGYGAREIGSGILCLSIDKKAGLASRIAGDSLDIATLSLGMDDRNPKRGNVVLALALVGGIGLLDLLAFKLVAARHDRDDKDEADYTDRSGFPKGVTAARGQARDFITPRDMRETLVAV
ncbi:MAG: hypothetical protein DCF30_21625 [Hyphomicrobiales bacterium]|nr:MAG: hypothetical protein DCF30_21625 [Hyphomicrobiales bacterium]